MFHVDEFEQLHGVPGSGHQSSADGICCEGTEAFASDTEVGDRPERAVLHQRVHFVLTAGDGQHHAGLPLYGLSEGIIGRGIAGVKRYDQIRRTFRCKTGDFSGLKLQLGQAQVTADLTARGHHIFATVQSGDAAGTLSSVASRWCVAKVR